MKKTLQVYLRSLLLSGMFLVMGARAYANHISAMDLSYTYVSSTGSGATMSSVYLVTVTIYGNCSDMTGSYATLPTTAPQVCVYNGTTLVSTLTLAVQAPTAGVNVTNVCQADTGLTSCTTPTSSLAGNKKFVYSATVTLTGTSAVWRFIYEGYNGPAATGAEAGRSSLITTLTMSSTVIYMVDTLNNTAAIPYNTSTTLPVIPTPYYCENQPDDYNPGGVNALGDSLVYQLVQPRQGTGADACSSTLGGLVAYNPTVTPALSATAPIEYASAFSFSSVNGQITFTPANTGVSVVDYNIREFRNGVLVGTCMREMNIAVQGCTIPAPTGNMRTPSNGAILADSTTFEVCENSGIFSFNVAGLEDSTNYEIFMTASNIPTGATYSIANDSTNHPVATFTWTSTGVTPGTYTFNILYAANDCPVTSTGSEAYNVIIEPVPSAIAGTPTVCTGETVTLTDVLTGGTWSSSNTAVATAGTSSGIISGVAAGTGTITYSYSAAACSVNTQVTVTGPAAIAGTLTVCPTLTITLTDAVTGGVWTSQNTATATVGATGIVTGVAGGTVNISYTLPSTGCFVVAPVTVTALAAITPSPTTVCIGNTIQLSDATSGGVWSSSSTVLATVSAAGMVGGVGAGTVNIFYTVGICYASATVSVSATGPVAISPSTAVEVCVGGTASLTDASSGGTWSSSTTGVATVNSTGVVSGVTAGAATISYFLGGCWVIKPVTVISGIAAITPATSTICIANSETLTETTTGGSWSSGNTLIATIAGAGTTATVTGAAAGTVPISYSIGSCYVTATVTVAAGPQPISPDGAIICNGSTTTLTDPTTGGTWSSNNTAVASVNTGGVITGATLGTAIISYTASGCGATAVATVVAAPAAILPATATICTGNTATLTESVSGGVWSSTNTAVATVVSGVVTGATAGTTTISYAAGTCVVTAIVTVDLAPDPGIITGASILCVGGTTGLTDAATGGVWSSSTTTVATVTTAGVVSGVSSGTSTISYSKTVACGTVSTLHLVSVDVAPTAGTVTAPASICSGTTSSLSDGVTGGTWTASNTFLSINSTSGLVTGVSPGIDTVTYTITSSCGTVSTTVSITVGAFLSAGTITGSVTSICAGATMSLADATTGGTWSSSNTSATVSAAGLVTGSSGGGLDTINYTVTSSCGAAVASYPITVNAVPAAAPILGPAVICLGSTAIFTDATTGGTWSSSNTNVSVTTGGVVTGAALGSATVAYTVTNACGTSVVTVAVTVSASVSAGTISGASSLCIGSTTALTDVGGSGGVWSASNTTASVTSGGVVTGLTSGTDTIYYTVAAGCGSAVASQVITITTAVFGAGTITGPGSVCVGSLISLLDAVADGAWSSSNAHATITTGGAVTGISPGLDTISYTITSSCGIASTSTVITIIAGSGSSTISGPAVVCAGTTVTLTDATTGGVWTSLNGNALVNSTSGVVTGVATGTDVITYTVTTSCGTVGTTTVITIGTSASAGTIAGPDSVCLGSTIALVDFTTGGVWSSGNTNATITTGGIVTGAAIGTAPITYTVSGSCGIAIAVSIIRIVPNPVAGVITGPASVCVGSGISLVDAASGGVWAASNPNVSIVAPGVIDGVAPGTDTIYYVVSNACGSSAASKVLAVHISPIVPALTGPTSQCTGATALILLEDATTGGIWSSSNSAVASVNPVTGVIEGASGGVAEISYTVTNSFGCSTIATSLDTVTTTPPVDPIGGSTTACIGSPITLTDATTGGAWSSGDVLVATIDPVFGVLYGVSTGTVIVSYSVVNSCGVSYSIAAETINPLPFVAPIGGPSSACIGSTILLTDATSGGAWSSDNTAVATVDPITGIVTGVAGGIVTINYNYSGSCPITVSTTISVIAGPSIDPIAGTTSECIGTTASLSDGSGSGVWTSSNTLVATVSSGGVVTGITAGTATIFYTVTAGCSSSATVIDSVLTIPVEAAITGVVPICAGSNMNLSNTSPDGVWSSGNTAIAIVNAVSGVVTGISGGTAEIHYTISNICGSAADSAAVTIAASPSVSAIIAAFTSLCAGTSVHLSDGTTGGVWSSSNTTIATVSTAGIVTGVSTGTDTVRYTIAGTGGCSNSAAVTITIGGSIASGAITPTGSVTLCHGHTVLLHIVSASGTGTTYQWLLNGGPLAGATNSSYTATSIGIYSAVINNGICSETITGPTIISPPNPVISFTAPDILSTTAFPAYEWFVNGGLIPGDNGSSITAGAAGTYKVVVTDNNGCSDTSGGYVVTGSGVNGINNVASGSDIKVYPNPATSVVRIDAPVTVNVSVVGIEGQVLISKKGATSVDISQLADGMYMIMVYNEQGILLKVTKFAKVE